MASNTQAYKGDQKGYDHKFVDPVPNELLCLICIFPARYPQQSTCCGKVFCKACVDELKKHSDKCPGCRGDINCFPDKRSKSCVNYMYSHEMMKILLVDNCSQEAYLADV